MIRPVWWRMALLCQAELSVATFGVSVSNLEEAAAQVKRAVVCVTLDSDWL